MRLKVIVGTLLAALLCGALTAAVLKSRRSEPIALAKGMGQQAEVEVVQLPSVNGVIPVEIRNQKITHDTLQGELQFTVKNNASKPLTAAVVAIEFTYLVIGSRIEEKALTYRTRNMLIHPDIREIHNQKPIQSGEEMIFGPEPIEFVGAPQDKLVPLKKITLSLDYVDFEDKSSLGLNRHGLYSVIKVRRGAARYKEWLVKQFMANGRSENALVSILRTPDLPSELNLPKDHEITGARLYRRHLLHAYDHYGFSAIEKYLK